MSPQPGLRLVIDDEADLAPAPQEAAAPRPFVRVITVPPGAPWDQARAADLEARLGAPLPLADVVFRLRRLDRWRPGSAGRYAVAYLRARDAVSGLAVTAPIDGRNVEIQFVDAREQMRRARRVLVVAVAATATVLACVAGVTLSLARRAEAEARLVALEQTTAMRSKAADAYARRKAQALALDGAGARGRRLEDVMEDLAWAARAKAPAARLRAFHWDHGYLALEVQGEAAPFERPDRKVVKAAKPIRRGVWLWGVEPAGEGRAR